MYKKKVYKVTLKKITAYYSNYELYSQYVDIKIITNTRARAYTCRDN